MTISDNEFEDNLMKEFKNTRKELGLFSAKEKSLLKERLMRYADENPVVRPSEKRDYSFFTSFQNSFFGSFVTPVLIIVFLFSGIGVSAAAESSLPGDTLYPIKVSLNETIRETFTLGQEAKEEWKIRQVERRFEEVVLLKEKGEITIEKESLIKERINRHIESLDSIALNFEEKGQTKKAELLYLKLEEVFQKESDKIENEKMAIALRNKDSANDAGLEDKKVEDSLSITTSLSEEEHQENNGSRGVDEENLENPSKNPSEQKEIAQELQSEIGGIIFPEDGEGTSSERFLRALPIDNLEAHINQRAKEARIKAQIKKLKQEISPVIFETQIEEIEKLETELREALLNEDSRLFNQTYNKINSLLLSLEIKN